MYLVFNLKVAALAPDRPHKHRALLILLNTEQPHQCGLGNLKQQLAGHRASNHTPVTKHVPLEEHPPLRLSKTTVRSYKQYDLLYEALDISGKKRKQG